MDIQQETVIGPRSACSHEGPEVVRLSRRQMLWTLPFLTSGVALARTYRKPPLLTITDPHMPPGAFDSTMDSFRKMAAAPSNTSPEQRLQDTRNWLAGQELPAKQGEWAEWKRLKSGLRLRILRPAGPLKGAVLSIHGGGWVSGTAVSDEKRNWLFARQNSMLVVSPGYRLAPEHPFPAAPQDCLEAARWLLKEGHREFAVDRFYIVGASAGSHLAAQTLINLSGDQRREFQAAVFYYGVFNLGRSVVWREAKAANYPDLSPDDMNRFVEWFVPGQTDATRAQARYSPLSADLITMPPAIFLVGSADLLFNDSELMARRWAEAGSPAELVVYPGAPHGFDGYGIDCGLDPHQYAIDFIRKHPR